MRYIVRMPVHIFAQSEKDAEQFRRMGVLPEKITVAGNTKFDQVVIETDKNIPNDLRSKLFLADQTPVIVAGSIHPGEFPAVLTAYQHLKQEYPALCLIIAPRHLEKLPLFTAEMDKAGEKFILLSQVREDWTGQILCVDSYGKLQSLYAIAKLAFVGGSLVPIGGHNPLEPITWGIPVLMGPYTNNCRDTAQILRTEGLLSIVNGENDIYEVVDKWLKNPEELGKIKDRAKEIITLNKGAASKTVEGIAAILGEV